MSGILKINSCAISHIGIDKSQNLDGFYMNGRFTSESHVDNIQASMEYSGSEFVFAVMDGMEVNAAQDKSQISVIKELRRFHERISVSPGDITYKTDELKSRVEEINNLIHSLSLGNDELEHDSKGFCGLIVSESKAVAVNIGSCKIYLLRDGIFKHLTVDYAKTERLLKLGIITEEQANNLSKRFGIPGEENKIEVQVSDILNIKEGDKFLLCSDGLANSLEDERINEILEMKGESDYLANLFLNEASKNGSKDDITILLVKVDKSDENQTKSIVKPNMNRKKSTNSIKFKYTKKDRNRITKYVTGGLVAITSIVLIILLVYAYKTMIDPPQKSVENQTNVPVQSPSPEPTPATNQDEVTPTPAEMENAGNVTEPIHYIVEPKDTLEKISKKYYNDTTKYKKLAEYNNIEDPNSIKVGQELLIPDLKELEK